MTTKTPFEKVQFMLSRFKITSQVECDVLGRSNKYEVERMRVGRRAGRKVEIVYTDSDVKKLEAYITEKFNEIVEYNKN